jgi:hypothetical protein
MPTARPCKAPLTKVLLIIFIYGKPVVDVALAMCCIWAAGNSPVGILDELVESELRIRNSLHEQQEWSRCWCAASVTGDRFTVSVTVPCRPGAAPSERQASATKPVVLAG